MNGLGKEDFRTFSQLENIVHISSDVGFPHEMKIKSNVAHHLWFQSFQKFQRRRLK